MDDLGRYLHQISSATNRGNATEHTHRPALKSLLEGLFPGVVATNEPRRIACGAPDYIITRQETPLGFIEAKDIGKTLNEVEKSDQMRRYLQGLSNLILTDYLEFRWYVDGARRMIARVDASEPDALRDLLTQFIHQAAPNVRTPRDLAARMAGLAKIAKQVIVDAFNVEAVNASGFLHQQLDGFREVLLHDMDEEQFADMYAQTIAYGLFAARCNTKPGLQFNRMQAAWLLPSTNPFLRTIFNNIAGPSADDNLAWIIDSTADLLDHADIEGILADFGKRTRREDPIVHFYETFLSEYDPKTREARGVYYTPEPVVSYIVRSVDQILRRDFDCEHGLADESKVTMRAHGAAAGSGQPRDVHRVQILDPATGTGTFLYGVINQISERFIGNKGAWPGYVSDHLLPRLFGFELLMAPYAVAHLKLGLLLKDSGYDIDRNERLGIYMTNTLEDATKIGGSLFAQEVAQEANAAYAVKKDAPVMVVLGNPPYSRDSLNKGPWSTELLNDYKRGLVEKKLNWDDFAKFIRFAQDRIDKTGYGVLAFITNNSYLDAITLRRMRESLLESFDDIYVLDLHGDSLRKERPPDGGKDENVFDIRQGVAIGIFVKKSNNRRGLATIRHAELWGSRASKYEYLAASDVSNTGWTVLEDVDRDSCLGKSYFLRPMAADYLDEYCRGWSVEDLFIVGNNGIKTDRDPLFLDFDKSDLLERMRLFYSPQGVEEPFAAAYGVANSSSYDLLGRRQRTAFDALNVMRCLYRPYDTRWLYYSAGLTSRPAFDVMRHMVAGENLALIATRQTADDWDVFVTNGLAGHKSCAAYDINTVYPLYLYPASTNGQACLAVNSAPGGRQPNLSQEFVNAIAEKLGMTFINDGRGDLQSTFGPADVFDYAYSVFHSPKYRFRYAEFLKCGYPRLPLTGQQDLFRDLCTLGRKIMAMHLSNRRGGHPATYPIPLPKSDAARDMIERVHYAPPTSGIPGRVHINKSQFFEGVSAEVWNFRVGGYQVCAKWLQDRRGRCLKFDDIDQYSNIVAAIDGTIRTMREIDAAIENHGGWPIS